MQHHDPSLPPYLRIKAHIAEQIHSGNLKPGARLPSESDLVAAFSVSRMTVSRALNELASEGAITRVQGRGSFVSKAHAETITVDLPDIVDTVMARGAAHSIKLLLSHSKAHREGNALLGLPAGTVHHRMVLLHLADDTPVQLEDRRINPNFAPDFPAQDFTRITPHNYLMTLGSLQAAEHAIEATAPTRRTARWLKIDPATPCLALRHRIISRNMVASVATLTSPSAQWRLTGQTGDAPVFTRNIQPF